MGIDETGTSAAVDSGASGSLTPLLLDLDLQHSDSIPDIGRDKISYIKGKVTIFRSHKVGTDWMINRWTVQGIVEFTAKDTIIIQEPAVGTTTFEFPLAPKFGMPTSTNKIQYKVTPLDNPFHTLDHATFSSFVIVNSDNVASIPVTIYSDSKPDSNKEFLLPFASEIITNNTGVGINTT